MKVEPAVAHNVGSHNSPANSLPLAPCASDDYQPRRYPQVVKYMGSKAAILGFLGAELRKIHGGGRPIVDLFAGACSLSGGFGHLTKMVSNDIQEYSAVIASSYLRRAEKIAGVDLVALATPLALARIDALPQATRYRDDASLAEFNQVERANRSLLQREFDYSHHLFTRVYSGTWWSAEQCVWIDALRETLDDLLASGTIERPDFDFGLTCLMHAMAYTSQGTGHYAQYRDAKTESSMADIKKYRRASVPTIFQRKFASLLEWNLHAVIDHRHEMTALDYRECLAGIDNAVVYADPPYAFVHYSRFYHAMETLVKYDYPVIQHVRDEVVKGRYRSERHQSPFCIRTQVRGAFVELFDGVRQSQSDLMLSYSNTGMIGIDDLMSLASSTFGSGYEVWFEHTDHTHMTMGRRQDHSRQVRESLIVAKKKPTLAASVRGTKSANS